MTLTPTERAAEQHWADIVQRLETRLSMIEDIMQSYVDGIRCADEALRAIEAALHGVQP